MAKPKFRAGQYVKFLDKKDGDYIAELMERDKKLPGIWHWRIKGFSVGTAPEHLIRRLTTSETRARRWVPKPGNERLTG